MAEYPVRGRNPHVVVVGGGFGGLHAVHALRDTDVDVTLIDRHTYNQFQPLLYQVATAALNPGDVTYFLRSVRARQRNLRFVKGTVLRMDHSRNVVTLDDDTEINYDYLVIAAGATTNYFGVPGAAEHAMPLYRRSQALAIRDRMFASLEDAAVNGQSRDLRIVVVGGGPTGVETAGAFAELRDNNMPVTYPELDPERTHVTLVEMMPNILGPFHSRLQNYAHRALRRRHVDVRVNTAVREVRPDGVMLGEQGEFLPSSLVVWASGVTTHESLADWDVPRGRGGRIIVDEQLRVPGSERVFAVGDIAVEEGERALPQLAQPAIQGGRYVGELIAAEIDGSSRQPFRYRDRGTMATIGRGAAVAEVKGLGRVTGLVAWVLWMVIHIYGLLGNRNRFATVVNLGARYLFRNGSHNAIVGETPPITSSRGRPPC